MSNLKYWEDKIKQKRKNTPFLEFLLEITSWLPISFYRNNGNISKYHKSDRINICSIEEYQKNRDDLLKKGFYYDYSKDFFSNYKKLFLSIDHECLFQAGLNDNTKFADTAVNVKNVYLSNTVTIGSENVYYSVLVRINSKNIFNSLFVVDNSEIVYFSKGINKSFKIFYSSFIKNSSDIWFSTNLTGCSNCLFCDNLENVSYYIKNKKYEKEEYFKTKEILLSDKSKFLEYYNNLNNKGINHNSTNVIGNNIIESDNIENGYFVFNTKNSKNLMYTGSTTGGENWYDFAFGGEGNLDIYGVCSSGFGCSKVYLSRFISSGSTNIYYSSNIESCSYLFGCIGLKNKSYCIFNKQFEKEEWEKEVCKIFAQMDSDGILGDFFPGDLNPSYFNDTVAGLLGEFSREDVLNKGYLWRDEEIKVDIPEGVEVITTKDLNNYQGFDSNGNWQINPEILKKVIKDEKGNIYRIVQMEYDFLMKHGLPLPEIHWLDRIKMGFKFK
ncbi:MAG: hypothetical protein PHS49_02315 [Candidatus Gracilibacteria bacterium]|nr:hypothetical protein [Candidatus Gracilibacteria bacterium]